jgi:hypothetical protein
MLFHVFPQSRIRKFSHLFVSCSALLVVSALLLFFHPFKVYSAQMTLAWDPNTEPDLGGYKVYYGTSSGTYGVPLNVGNVTDYTLTGLTERGGYYIAVTAYDKSGNESVYSNEVSGAAREPTQTYTVATNPPGLQVTVDGAPHTASKKFSWIPGTSHTLSVESPQSGSAGVRYVFAYWSDGGDQGHTMIAPSSNTAFMVTFNVQWAEDTSGSQNPIVISVNGNKDIGVNFDLAMETVSTPNGPSGSREGTTGMSYLFETGGSTSSFGDPVQYLFDWGGGINSGWLAAGTTTASHSWNTPGAYLVKSQARCSSHPSAVSNWSEPMTMVVAPPLTMIGAIDYPVDGQRVSGITTIDGWALDGRGISKVELFVDDQFIGNIAYGSTLMDIKEIYPDYPGAENSGFCVIWNASDFSPGDHKIKVRLHNLDGHTKDLEVSTTVVKFHGKFVESISPSRNVLYYSEVTAEGTTQVYDIEIEWSKVSQGFVITEIKPR